MNYCGIDLAGVSSYAYVTDARGTKLWAGAIETTRVAFEGLVKKFARSGLAIAIEAGNQTAWVHEALVKLGAQVTVVNPTKVKLIAESRRKTDKVDAKILCELLRLDGLPHPVHMPGPLAREQRGLLVARRQLVAIVQLLFCKSGHGFRRGEAAQEEDNASRIATLRPSPSAPRWRGGAGRLRSETASRLACDA